jgi:hypothetical protein
MRPLLLVAILLLLAGCAGRDVAFEKEADGPEAFGRDDLTCATAAELGLPSRVVSYERNRLFNQLYGGCMIALGHKVGTYVRNLPDNSSDAAPSSGNS